MGEAMADQDLSHTAEIMRAALPFIDARNKVMVEFMMKVFDLMGSLKFIRNPNNLAACGFEASKIDMEGLLNGIRPVCGNREREIIDRILNFFSMKRMFEMYNKMMETMKTMQDFEGFPFGDFSEDAETVTGNFSDSNFDSIFNTAEHKEADVSSADSDYFSHAEPDDDPFGAEEEPSPPPGNSGFKMNDRMFDMLKAMVPPEQMSTFENLSMLLSSMSYDNNSKPDDSKEHSDG
jgi:hypothetical protein